MTTTIRIAVDGGLTGETVSVPTVATFQGVRPLRVGGLLVAEVRATYPVERELVADRRYAATWLGWHYGQGPGYGDTPEDAVRALAADLVEWPTQECHGG